VLEIEEESKTPPPPERICLYGRQYLYVPGPSPTLALVITRNGNQSVVASCGEETPADLAEQVKELLALIDDLGRMEDE
jgi:hypothetical protein